MQDGSDWGPWPEKRKKRVPVIIKVRYITEMTKLAKIKVGDWIDLYCSEDISFEEHEQKLINLGVAMQLPKNYEANIVARSSTLKNFGIIQANSFGVVDNSYCGDNDWWFFNAFAMRETFIPKNSKICQFRINKKQPEFVFEEVESLDNPDRGGHGTTGLT